MSVPSPNDPVIQELTSGTEGQRSARWELAALWFLNTNRVHEAFGLLWRLYQQMTAGQTGGWSHKGMPLVWISDGYTRLGFVVHAKRYLMLTLLEDALREQGVVTPNTSGVYFRLVWRQGLADLELRRYALRFQELAPEPI
jgi:hypothetical protein